jgi:hypothetical protein
LPNTPEVKKSKRPKRKFISEDTNSTNSSPPNISQEPNSVTKNLTECQICSEPKMSKSETDSDLKKVRDEVVQNYLRPDAEFTQLVIDEKSTSDILEHKGRKN